MYKEALFKAGMVTYKIRAQDYECCLNVLKHTDSIYLNGICLYYESAHGVNHGSI